MDGNAGQEEATSAKPDARVLAQVIAHLIIAQRHTHPNQSHKPPLSN